MSKTASEFLKNLVGRLGYDPRRTAYEADMLTIYINDPSVSFGAILLCREVL